MTSPVAATTTDDRARPAAAVRPARALRTSLTGRFLLANLAILLVAGIAIGFWVGGQLERGIIDRTASITALYVEAFIEPSLRALAAGEVLSETDLENLDELLVTTPLADKIVSLRVWSPDGTILYSPDRSLIGQRFPVEGDLAAAWAGTVTADMSSLSGEENTTERARWDRLLEMYVPVRERGSDRIIAVAEFYQLPGEIDRQVGDARVWSWAIVAVAIVVSVALLTGIVKQGSDTITRQEAALTRQVGELSALLEQNEALSERVRTAAERATTTNERALRRISADLHDGPGQMLSLALLRLDSLRHGPEGARVADLPELTEAERALQDAMKDMRAIAAGLRLPELASLSLAEVATRAVSDHERRSGTPVVMQLGPLPSGAPLSVKISYFRALGELLSNATRHGGGVGVRVGVTGTPDQLRLEVADDGPGFDPAQLADSAGLGLPGLREQAELLGGGSEVDLSTGRRQHGPGLVVAPGAPRHDEQRMNEPIRVLVADDHPMFRAGVVASIGAADDIAVVAQADDAPSALALAREHLPDVALLDVNMPGGGLVAARDITAACPVTRVVMLTVSEDEDDLLAAMKAGASGYVLKGAGAQELIGVLRSVHAGEVYVAPALAWGMLREMSRPRSSDPIDELTTREREVLELVAQGLSNQEIGERLSLAEKTIKHYMTNILGKLQVRSRVEAALLAYRRGLGGPPDDGR